MVSLEKIGHPEKIQPPDRIGEEVAGLTDAEHETGQRQARRDSTQEGHCGRVDRQRRQCEPRQPVGTGVVRPAGRSASRYLPLAR